MGLRLDSTFSTTNNFLIDISLENIESKEKKKKSRKKQQNNHIYCNKIGGTIEKVGK